MYGQMSFLKGYQAPFLKNGYTNLDIKNTNLIYIHIMDKYLFLYIPNK